MKRSLPFYGLYALFHAAFFAVLWWRGRDMALLTALVVAEVVALLVLETVAPARQDWKARRGDELTLDVLMPLALALCRPLVAALPFFGLAHTFTKLPAAAFATPLRSLPFVVQCTLAVLLSDLVIYWMHRLMHSAWLWPFHAVHHQIEELSAIRSLRLHPLEEIVGLSLATLLPLLVGLDHEAVAFTARNSMLIGFLQHANIAFGGAGGVLPTPTTHGRHHASDLPHGNFGIVTTLCDRVFGTYRSTTHAEMAATPIGIAGSDLPRTFLGQLAYPFVSLGRAFRDARAAGGGAA